MNVYTVMEPEETFSPMMVTADYGDAYMVKMAVSQWIAMPNHPLQPAYSPQRQKSSVGLASVMYGALKAKLRTVVAADLNGKLFKVDGHGRAALWAKGKLLRPDSVYATIYRCSSSPELNELHAAFHVATPSEDLHQRVKKAYLECGLNPTSPRLKNGTIGLALRMATHGICSYKKEAGEPAAESEQQDVLAQVRVFCDELRQLDSIGPQNELFPTGVIAAALLTLAIDTRHLQYFALLSRRKIKRKKGLLDPIGALLSMIHNLKEERGSRFHLQQEQLCAAALTGAFAWLKGESHADFWVQEGLPPADIQEVVHRVQQLKGADRPQS